MSFYRSAAKSTFQTKSILLVLAVVIAASAGASAQTFSIVFNLPTSANMPWGALTMDAAGNLYGTTTLSNTFTGTAFQLKSSHGTYLLNPLLNFSEPDGSIPYSGMTF